MNNKQKVLASISLIIITIILFITIWLNLVSLIIALPLFFTCLGCQQLFIGLRFYKEDKKSRKFYILFGIVYLLFTIFLILKFYPLI
jgi:uncharacterized membrane protein HdeD (DUF308 family)